MLLAAGCVNLDDMSFRNDHRMTITAPEHRQLTQRPVTVTWQMKEFRVAAPGSEPPSRTAGYFALFVDRAPIPPGGSLADIAASDRNCRRDPDCGSEQYFVDRGIYTATGTTKTLASVPDLPNLDSPQLHTITIVLLDTDGRRIGESAWDVEFKLLTRDN